MRHKWMGAEREAEFDRFEKKVRRKMLGERIFLGVVVSVLVIFGVMVWGWAFFLVFGNW